MASEILHSYDFGKFRIDLVERVLLSQGKPLALTPKAFQVLKVLVENHGHIVDKEQLLAEVWADSFVEEGNLAFNTGLVRKALNDDATKPTFIETVPRRGYRFIADVKENVNGHELTFPRPATARGYLSVAVVLVVVIGLLGVAAWFSNAIFRGEAAPILAAPFSAKKFSTSGMVRHAVISPDGKYVAFTDESGGKHRVWIRHLETSENVPVISPVDGVYAGLAYSHDGNSLYFVRRDQPKDPRATIYRVPAFGGIPQRVAVLAEGWISVSPDDKQISFVRCEYKDEDYCSLMIVDADGKNERKLVTEKTPMRISANQFSPDGRTVAFARGQSGNGSSEFGLFEADVNGGTIREITPQRFFNITSVAWLPDGNELLLAAKENLAESSKIRRVSRGGTSRVVTTDAQAYHTISLDRQAATMIAIQGSNDFRIYASSTDAPNDPRFLASGMDIAIGPDQRIVYSTDQGDIWSIGIDGREPRQLTSNNSSDFAPLVSADGRFVFFTSNRTGSNHVWRMNADGGSQVQLTDREGGYPKFASPDGKWVYFESGLSEKRLRVSSEGVGAESEVSEKVYSTVSPDGRFAVHSVRDKEQANRLGFAIRSLENDTVIKTFQFTPQDVAVFRPMWHRDDRTISVVVETPTASSDQGEAGSKYSIWRLSLDDGRRTFVAELPRGKLQHFAFAPDGKTFVYIRGRWLHDAVLIAGLM